MLPGSFVATVELLESAREARLAGELRTLAHLVRFEPGRIEFRPEPHADKTLASRLSARLGELTGVRWTITLSSEEGETTLAQQAMSAAEARREEAAEHPLVKAALEAFPGAKIVEVRDAPPVDEAPLLDSEVPDPDAYGEMDPDTAPDTGDPEMMNDSSEEDA